MSAVSHMRDGAGVVVVDSGEPVIGTDSKDGRGQRKEQRTTNPRLLLLQGNGQVFSRL